MTVFLVIQRFWLVMILAFWVIRLLLKVFSQAV